MQAVKNVFYKFNNFRIKCSVVRVKNASVELSLNWFLVNLLNRVFKEALSVEDFKVMIQTWKGKQCNCSFCHTSV